MSITPPPRRRRYSAAEAVAIAQQGGVDPSVPYPGRVNDPWPSLCLSCGSRRTPRLSAILAGHSGCGSCASKGRPAHNRLNEEEAATRLLALGAKPLEPFRDTHTPWRWQCLRCGAESTERTLKDAAASESACRRCGIARRADARRIPTAVAAREFVDAGQELLGEYVDAHTPVRVRCQRCGSQFEQRLANLRQLLKRGGRGCRTCAGALRGQAQTTPEPVADAEFRAFGYEPLEPFVQVKEPRKCRCMGCGRAVQPRLSSLRAGQGGCGACSVRFSYADPASLYLITHSSLGAHKLGITNTRKTRQPRLQQHYRSGWQLYRQHEFSSGTRAHQVEQAVLRWLREDRALSTFLTADQMPQRGATETVAAAEIDLDQVWRRVLMEAKKVTT